MADVLCREEVPPGGTHADEVVFEFRSAFFVDGKSKLGPGNAASWYFVAPGDFVDSSYNDIECVCFLTSYILLDALIDAEFWLVELQNVV